MTPQGKPLVRVYDPRIKKYVALEDLIVRMGVAAVARKYKVTDSAVRKWRAGKRHQSQKSLKRLWKELF